MSEWRIPPARLASSLQRLLQLQHNSDRICNRKTKCMHVSVHVMVRVSGVGSVKFPGGCHLNHLRKHDGKMALMFVSCILLKKIAGSLLLTDLGFSSAVIFHCVIESWSHVLHVMAFFGIYLYLTIPPKSSINTVQLFFLKHKLKLCKSPLLVDLLARAAVNPFRSVLVKSRASLSSPTPRCYFIPTAKVAEQQLSAHC